jgi:hypothetical protein
MVATSTRACDKDGYEDVKMNPEQDGAPVGVAEGVYRPVRRREG